MAGPALTKVPNLAKEDLKQDSTNPSGCATKYIEAMKGHSLREGSKNLFTESVRKRDGGGRKLHKRARGGVTPFTDGF